MCMTAVKGPVYEFDLGYFLFDKKAEFFFYQLDITKPHFFIDRRKTITTGERTASGGFIINDLVFELFHIFITEWDRAHIHRLCHSGKCHRFVPFPVCDPRNPQKFFFPLTFLCFYITAAHLFKRMLALSDKHSVDSRIFC